MIEYLLLLPAFPIVFFSALIFEGIDRKVHARLQRRIGPPVLQPLYDFVKLMHKEQLIPVTASRRLFIFAPVIAVAVSILVASFLVSNALIFTAGGDIVVGGDLLLIIYLITMVSIMMMVGGLASGNPYATVGFGRKMTLLIAYKIPLVLSVMSLALHPAFSLILVDIMSFQVNAGVMLAVSSPSKILALITFQTCLPAAAETVPFDIADAKSEIMSGILIEYGGPCLAMMKLAKSTMTFSLVFIAATAFLHVPAFLDLSFLEQVGNDALASVLAGIITWGFIMATSLAVLVLSITMPRSILARVKIGQAFKYHVALPLSLAIAAVILSIMTL